MMDSENKSSQSVPSMLREANSRHDEIESRIKTIKEYSENLGIFAPKELENDEHYWFTVMNRNHIVSNILKDSIPDKEQLKIASLNIAAKEAEEFLRLEQMKSTDTLTKAWSRGALDNFLENLRSKSRLKLKDSLNTQKLTVGIMLMDGDNFKKYNDTNGHVEGDKLLINLVKTIKNNTRGIDMVARYGGEEFAVVVPNLPQDTASAVISEKAEKIRETIEKDKVGITVSIGATILKDTDENINGIYKRVDENLYKAKENGKNIVCSDNGIVLKNK
jgi:diguanylate cyclase (GGDEF)-like protein